ncbi:hypothetical protein [Paenibacillus mendelii]|uniref:DUF4025 domain-containing protein n=1 Tax=Paenibacillus mendelii TaxID=206163 RepID=A0ABV6J1P1_9BACL|nr:hypothetical protein [Paenibacillus mendelii]MCQ6563197.1 hypothetical protein [Paenibacillus mendelii]
MNDRNDHAAEEAELAYITALIRDQVVRGNEMTNVPSADVFDAAEDIDEQAAD